MSAKKPDFFEEHPELWHYTNKGVLMGIVESSSLWATDFHCTNDLEECQSAKPIVIKYLVNYIKIVRNLKVNLLLIK